MLNKCVEGKKQKGKERKEERREKGERAGGEKEEKGREGGKEGGFRQALRWKQESINKVRQLSAPLLSLPRADKRTQEAD